MGSIIAFLLRNWQLVVIGVLVAALGASHFYSIALKNQKAVLIAEKATLQTELIESQANVKQLTNDIQSQNTAIDKLKTAADERVEKNAAEVKKAQTVADTYKKQAQELMKRTIPQNVSKCDAANLLINEEIRNAHK